MVDNTILREIEAAASYKYESMNSYADTYVGYQLKGNYVLLEYIQDGNRDPRNEDSSTVYSVFTTGYGKCHLADLSIPTRCWLIANPEGEFWAE